MNKERTEPAEVRVRQRRASTPGTEAGRAQRLSAPVRRELILDTALKLYAERHYSIVSMRAVADACGINVALIYHYFDGKDDLFRSVLGYMAERVHADFKDAGGPGTDALGELNRYFGVQARIGIALTRWVKIMADYAACEARDAATDAIIAAFYEREQAFLEACLRRGIDEGEFRPVDIAAVSRMIGVHLDGIFHTTRIRNDDRLWEDIAALDRTVREVLRVPSTPSPDEGAMPPGPDVNDRAGIE